MAIEYDVLADDDLDEASELWLRSDGIGTSQGDDPDSLRAFLRRNPGTSFVARSDGRLVGAVMAGHDGRRGYLYHLAVDPSVRRQGIGRELCTRAFAALEDAGIPKCHVHVYVYNDGGLGFWRADGWTDRHDLQVLSRLTKHGASAPR